MESISQHSLHDELLGRLRQMIIRGQFVPGDKIPERLLCEQFGVSRTPLREALKVLAAEGLVQLAPNRGAVVAELSGAEFKECLPISAAIEALASELACDNITDAEIEEIRQLNAQMTAQYEAGDSSGFVATNQRIHERIVAATRNPLLIRIYGTMVFKIGWAQRVSQLSQESIDTLLADHDAIFQALESRDGRRLAELQSRCLEHLFGAHKADDAGEDGGRAKPH